MLQPAGTGAALATAAVAERGDGAGRTCLNTDVLELVFHKLDGPRAFSLVVGLSRHWRAWAAARWMERDAARPAAKRRPLPLCFVRDVWPRLGAAERRLAVQLAARAGLLSVLRFALANAGCPLDETVCEEAARGGSVAALGAARAAGAPWDARTCRAAVLGDHVAALRYALAAGCAADKHASLLAAQLGSVRALQALREHACPWDPDECRHSAELRGHAEVVDYVDRQPR